LYGGEMTRIANEAATKEERRRNEERDKEEREE
jgi:hypothetical protein